MAYSTTVVRVLGHIIHEGFGAYSILIVITPIWHCWVHGFWICALRP